MANVGSQPNSKAWELSLYELHRKPHDMVSDETAIAVSPRALHSELMCPICLDLMTCTLTTKECLHRFCQDCIITALRSGNKECPTCRKKLVSKRSLRADPNFDALIAKIYPNRDELNAQQTAVRSRSQVTIQKRKRKLDVSVSPPALDRHEEKRQKTPIAVETIEQVEDISDRQPSQPLVGCGTEEVELQLRPHPHDPSVSEHAIRDLSTHPVATVAHLAKYLSIYPMLESEKDNKTTAVRALHFNGQNTSPGDKKYTLYIQLSSDSDFTVLPNGTSLRQICDNYWMAGDKLKIYFAIDERLASQS